MGQWRPVLRDATGNDCVSAPRLRLPDLAVPEQVCNAQRVVMVEVFVSHSLVVFSSACVLV